MSGRTKSTKSLEDKIQDIILSCTDQLTELGATVKEFDYDNEKHEQAFEAYRSFLRKQTPKVQALVNKNIYKPALPGNHRQYFLHPSKWCDDINTIYEDSGTNKVRNWSANSQVRVNDVFLLYYPKNGPRTNLDNPPELTSIINYPSPVSDLVLNRPASIYAMCRCISHPFHIKTAPDWHWRVFVSNYIFFKHPLSVAVLPDQKRVMFVGGFFSPRRFPSHGTLLEVTRNKLMETNPDLVDSYLQYSNYWRDEFPLSDDPRWISKISGVPDGPFSNEDIVKEYFIQPLLQRVVSREDKIEAEHAIRYGGEMGSVDYIISRGKRIFPVEAKHEINNRSRVKCFAQICWYMSAVGSKLGMLIDRNAVMVVGNSGNIQWTVKRKELTPGSLAALKKMIAGAMRGSDR